MEIEVGEYVRTNKGNIGNVIDIFQGHCTAKYHIQFQGNVKVKRQYLSTKTIAKHSKNIIDLIEVGDIVEVLDHDWLRVFNIDDEDILKSFIEDCEENNWKLQGIMTKEVYEQNCFKLDTN